MPMIGKFAPPLAALALLVSLTMASAQGGEPQERGAGASGQGDGSGMGQDNTESGTPKGPGDKRSGVPGDPAAGADPKSETGSGAPTEGTSSEGPGLIGRCDDGRPPIEGACPR